MTRKNNSAIRAARARAKGTDQAGIVFAAADSDRLAAGFPLRPRIPTATYRLQFSAAFKFQEARRLIPYLHELGITDCYASPYLKASPGSTHGYDVADHNALNPTFGSDRDYDRFVATLQQHGMGQIMDFVPSHMGIASSANTAWMDVLENGPGSAYATFFDIDWHPLMVGDELENKVLLPILGDPYGKVLENQELRLVYEEGTFYVHYYDTKLPVGPHTQVDLLSLCLNELTAQFGGDDERLQEYQSIITALGHLPLPTETAPEKIAERQREKEVIKRRLDSLYQGWVEMRAAIDQTVGIYDGVRDEPRSFDRLDALLDKQCYRLAYWRVAADEINYRRFCDVNGLAAIRMELPDVFRQTHQLILQLLEDGKITGLRIDHPDGLWDPAGYFRELQRSYFLRMNQRYVGDGQGVAAHEWRSLEPQPMARRGDQGAGHPDGRDPLALYLIAEKILSDGERLPENWAVYGTTGYEFASAVNGLFVARANRKAFDHIYASFIGGRMNFHNVVNSCKKMIMLISLASEVNMLGYQLKRIAAKNRWHRDFTLNSLTFAIREVIACLPVYRTYIGEDEPAPDRQDRTHVEAAISEARKRNPRTAASIFDFIGDILLQRHPANISEDDRLGRATLVRKFQQTSGPVMAKGMEDTAYYVYNRLVSLNEVGGNPEQFGISVAAFHRQNAERQRHWPHSLICTTTHDTKRSEDVRARINVLSEMPRQWQAALGRWSKLNRGKKRSVGGVAAPDANEEYLLYQTLLGAWPLEALDEAGRSEFVARMQAYVLKAIREAKVNTTWINPNSAYDAAVEGFVRDILDDTVANPFLEDFAVLEQKVAHYGIYNSLGQTLLKVTSPGVPDLYQGNEIWDFSMVDPDNRRPVDFGKRRRLLNDLQRRSAQAGGDRADLARRLVDAKEDGRIKLYVTSTALNYRRDHEELFRRGAYVPLRAAGSKRQHVCAFARRLGRQVAVVVVPRLVAGLAGGACARPLGSEVWGDSSVAVPQPAAGRRYRNVFTGEVLKTLTGEGRPALPLHAVFATFPVALLETMVEDSE